jgi:hypothetical protein
MTNFALLRHAGSMPVFGVVMLRAGLGAAG